MSTILTYVQIQEDMKQNIAKCIHTIHEDIPIELLTKLVEKWWHFFILIRYVYSSKITNLKWPAFQLREYDHQLQSDNLWGLLKRCIDNEDTIHFRGTVNYEKLPKMALYSKIGGFSYSALIASPFVCLGHHTTLSGIENIFKYRTLDHRASIWKKGISVQKGTSKSKPKFEVKQLPDFPGIYTTIITQHTAYGTEYFVTESGYGPITLIISLAVLQQRNWHFNTHDLFGDMNNDTFSAKTLPLYLSKIQWLWNYSTVGETEPHDNNELVVHDAIPIELIEAVVVLTEESKIQLELLCEKYNINIQIIVNNPNTFVSINAILANTQFLKGCDTDLLVDTPPQYCYARKGIHPNGYSYENPYTGRIKNILPNKAKLENAYLRSKQLANCGVTKAEDIAPRMKEIIFGDHPRIVVTEENNPPYKFTPEYYED